MAAIALVGIAVKRGPSGLQNNPSFVKLSWWSKASVKDQVSQRTCLRREERRGCGLLWYVLGGPKKQR